MMIFKQTIEKSVLIDIHDKTCSWLGIEVCGFLRHLLVCVHNILDVLNSGGIENEAALVSSLVDRGNGFIEDAGVIHTILIVAVHYTVDDKTVKNADVKVLKCLAAVWHDLLHGIALASESEQVPCIVADIPRCYLAFCSIKFGKSGFDSVCALMLFDMEIFLYTLEE